MERSKRLKRLPKFLLDTSPLIIAAKKKILKDFYTTMPVIVEADYFLREKEKMPSEIWREGIGVIDLKFEEVIEENLKFGFADASIISALKKEKLAVLITNDRKLCEYLRKLGYPTFTLEEIKFNQKFFPKFVLEKLKNLLE